MRKLVRTAAYLVVALALGGCGGPTAASVLATPPEYAPAGQTKCSVMKSHDKPLVVEWPSADRGELEARALRGLVAVHYSGCEMRVLPRCTIPAKYTYRGVTMKKDHIAIRNADDLYTQIPLGAARLEGKLKTAGELDVETTLVGRWESERPVLRVSDLQGECTDATHFISALTVGAFTFSAAADASVSASATVLGAGGGAHSSSKRELLNTDGQEQACEKTSSDDKGPPAQCGALLRLEVTKLAEPAGKEAIDPAKLMVSRRTLSNGLTVILHEDHSTSEVAVAFAYSAGANFDPAGREGMSFLFEQLLWGLGPPGKEWTGESMRALGAKGYSISSKHDHFTTFALVPPSSFEAVLAIEADRMTAAGGRIQAPMLDKARERLRQQVASGRQTSGGLLSYAVSNALETPGHSHYGADASMDAITVDEAKAFHDSFLGASGTALFVAGNIDPAKAFPMIEKAFAGVPRRARGSAPPIVTRLPSSARVDAVANNTPLILLSWLTPGVNEAGDAELDVIAEILGARNTGRLWRQLVTGSYSAKNLSIAQSSRLVASRFRIAVGLQAGGRPDDALRVVDAELALLGAKEASLEEVTAARDAVQRQLVPTTLPQKLERLTACWNLGVSDQSSCTDVMMGHYKNVTPQTVREAARALLPLDRRVVGVLNSDASAPAGGKLVEKPTTPIAKKPK